jgi:hypothetical protein
VRALVARPHPVRHLWTGEAAAGPVDGGPPWWAAGIFSAGLREAGFAVKVGLPLGVAGERGPGRAAPATAAAESSRSGRWWR